MSVLVIAYLLDSLLINIWSKIRLQFIFPTRFAILNKFLLRLPLYILPDSALAQISAADIVWYAVVVSLKLLSLTCRHFVKKFSMHFLMKRKISTPFFEFIISGSTAGGHYVAICKHPVSKKWHEFNDNL